MQETIAAQAVTSARELPRECCAAMMRAVDLSLIVAIFLCVSETARPPGVPNNPAAVIILRLCDGCTRQPRSGPGASCNASRPFSGVLMMSTTEQTTATNETEARFATRARLEAAARWLEGRAHFARVKGDHEEATAALCGPRWPDRAA